MMKENTHKKKMIRINQITLRISPLCTKSTFNTSSLTIWPSFIQTKIASDACNDKSLAIASDVLPWKIKINKSLKKEIKFF